MTTNEQAARSLGLDDGMHQGLALAAGTICNRCRDGNRWKAARLSPTQGWEHPHVDPALAEAANNCMAWRIWDTARARGWVMDRAVTDWPPTP